MFESRGKVHIQQNLKIKSLSIILKIYFLSSVEKYFMNRIDIDQRNGLRRASDLGDPQCSWSYGGHTHLTSMRYTHR